MIIHDKLPDSTPSYRDDYRTCVRNGLLGIGPVATIKPNAPANTIIYVLIVHQLSLQSDKDSNSNIWNVRIKCLSCLTQRGCLWIILLVNKYFGVKNKKKPQLRAKDWLFVWSDWTGCKHQRLRLISHCTMYSARKRFQKLELCKDRTSSYVVFLRRSTAWLRGRRQVDRAPKNGRLFIPRLPL